MKKISYLTNCYLNKWDDLESIHINNFNNKVLWILFQIFQGFDTISFGYGRSKTINFEDEYFYFQDGDKNELEIFIDKHTKKQYYE